MPMEQNESMLFLRLAISIYGDSCREDSESLTFNLALLARFADEHRLKLLEHLVLNGYGLANARYWAACRDNAIDILFCYLALRSVILNTEGAHGP